MAIIFAAILAIAAYEQHSYYNEFAAPQAYICDISSACA